MGFLVNFKRNRHRRKAWSEAYDYKRAGKFSEAAKVYERIAIESLEYNELIYEGDCHDAATCWLKAGHPESALRNAREALKVIARTDWLKESNTTDDICKMVGEFYEAGYAPAADTFANEINAALVAHNLPPRFDTKHGKFPVVCPQCGGALPTAYTDLSLTCPFCQAVIHAE